MNKRVPIPPHRLMKGSRIARTMTLYAFYTLGWVTGWLPFSVGQAETAYDALQTLRRQRGDAIVHQLLEVSGTQGHPQPTSWKVIVQDPGVGAGWREFVISRGQIVSERAPLQWGKYTGPVISMRRLNLNSDGAFQIAQQQAIQRKVSFDKVQYVLSPQEKARNFSSPGTPLKATPIWTLTLFDHQGRLVEQVILAAESGHVLQVLPFTSSGRFREPSNIEPPVRANIPSMARFVGNQVKTKATQVQNTVLRGAGSVEEFFTGKRTLDRNVPADDDDENDQEEGDWVY